MSAVVGQLVCLSRDFAFVSAMFPKKCDFGCEGKLANHSSVDVVHFFQASSGVYVFSLNFMIKVPVHDWIYRETQAEG